MQPNRYWVCRRIGRARRSTKNHRKIVYENKYEIVKSFPSRQQAINFLRLHGGSLFARPENPTFDITHLQTL